MRGSARGKIGIVAVSSPVPQVELSLGLEHLRAAGFRIQVHPICKKSDLFFAGTDEQRAEAFFDLATQPEVSVLWTARGGYGAARILPLLEKITDKRGTPPVKKLLVGYSDVTVLMEFVRKKWGWSILHAPMPSFRRFSLLPERDWQALCAWVRGSAARAPWEGVRLQSWGPRLKLPIEAPLVGGNIAVWTSALGTRFEPQTDGALLFLEEVDEPLYRIDRMLQQLAQSGSLSRIRAVVLGSFTNCRDTVPMVLKTKPSESRKKQMLLKPQEKHLKLLRPKLEVMPTLERIFQEFGQALKVPVFYGLPVGHGEGISPLPLGGIYRLSPPGELELLHWDWMGSPENASLAKKRVRLTP